jgi:hypothetical protein
MTFSQQTRLGEITAIMAIALAAACSSGPAGSATSNAGGTSPGASPAASTGAGTTSTSTSATAVAVSVGAAGGSTLACDPPAAPGTLYERTADAFGSAEPASMCAYRGDALLIVNVAAI